MSTLRHSHVLSEMDESGVSNSSTEPRRFRLLSEVYDDTEEMEFTDELLFMGIEEPVTYAQAAKEVEWKKAMDTEIQTVEKNKTWKLTDLPPG